MAGPLPEPTPIDLMPHTPTPGNTRFAEGGPGADRRANIEPHANQPQQSTYPEPTPPDDWPPTVVQLAGTVPTRQRLPDDGIADRIVAGNPSHLIQPWRLFPDDAARSSLVLVNRSATAIWYLGFSPNMTTASGSFDLRPGETLQVTNTAGLFALVSELYADLRVFGDRDRNLAR